MVGIGQANGPVDGLDFIKAAAASLAPRNYHTLHNLEPLALLEERKYI